MMGFKDNFSGVNAAVLAAFGQVITYTPAVGGAFDCSAVLGSQRIDELVQNVLRDVRDCSIPASVFFDRGLSGPVSRIERRTGDSVTVGGVSWTVSAYPSAELDETGMWKITLERNVRIVPS